METPYIEINSNNSIGESNVGLWGENVIGAWRKTSQSRVEKQQTNATYDVTSHEIEPRELNTCGKGVLSPCFPSFAEHRK